MRLALLSTISDHNRGMNNVSICIVHSYRDEFATEAHSHRLTFGPFRIFHLHVDTVKRLPHVISIQLDCWQMREGSVR